MQTLIRNLRFQYLKPSKFVEGLKKPDGIGSLTPNDTQMRLTVQGEKDAVELVAQMAKLADVKPLRYQLDLFLIKLGPGVKRVVLEKKSLLVENKGGVAVSLSGGACTLVGTLHGSPAEVQLVFEANAVRVSATKRETTESVQVTRRVPFRKPTQLARFSDPTTGPRRDKKPTPVTLVLEALASDTLGLPTR